MQTLQTKPQHRTTSNRAPGLVVSLILLLATAPFSHAVNGTWTNLMGNGSASGSWAAATNWNNSVIAGGTDSLADFSTLDLTNTTTVTLDGARTNGSVIIGDLVPSTNWTFNAGTPSTSGLWLSASAGSPTINVSSQIATFGASVFGANGFTKTGAGTLRLNAVNTNASGSLSNLIIVSAGILQIGNASAPGVAGNHASNERVICTNGGTLEIINGVQPSNKHLTLAGTGLGGTNGALYALISGNGTSTRWGLGSLNASYVSGNSSAAFPAISFTGDTTIRIDGVAYNAAPIGAADPSFAIGHLSCSNFTLIKTGSGRLSLDRGVSGLTNVIILGGGWGPNQGSSFGGILYYTVAAGAAILNNQVNCFGNAASIFMQPGSFFDINWRGNGTVGNDNTTFTQNIGYLNGDGILTTGSRGNTNFQTLVLQGSDSNSVFNGLVTVSNGIFNITKNGTNSFILGGTNNYNGNSTVSVGTWLVNGRHTGGSNYVVAVGATLGGKGAILSAGSSAITLNGPGSFLVAGHNGGTLTISNVSGAGDVYVTNANLTVLGQLNNSIGGQFLNSINLTNGTTTALLQQNGTEASIYASTVNVDGVNNILSYTTANPAIGQYPFIKYNSAIGGLNGFAGLQLVPPSGSVAHLSNNAANSSIDIVVTAIPALVWRGQPTGDWSIGGSANWFNVATPTAYTETAGQGPFVIFDDSAAGSTTVNLTATVTPKGITVISTNQNYTYTGSGLIAGNGSWIKDGPSTLTLANTSTNTYAGAITINNGAVSVGNGGTSGNLGAASVNNSGSLIFNRSDNVTIGNAITGTGSLVKQAANTTTLTGVGNIGSAVTVNAGTLALAPVGTITVSGDVTGNGAFGVSGAGTVILTSSTITYSGGTVITNGTLELDSVFPPSGNITDNGTLALGVGGTLANNISGTGGVAVINGGSVTLGGVNTYAGPTVVLGGSLDAAAANYSPASTLTLGSLTGGAAIGTANFTAGNPVLGGLRVGGNSISPSLINLSAGSSQTLTINGNVTLGNTPSAAIAQLQVIGTGASVVISTNGGTIQLGLGNAGSGINPDYVVADFSAIDNLTVNLGTTGVINLGTLDGNPGPPAGATVVNQFLLAAVSNSITAGAINIGAGGRQLVPELVLGAGTNLFNVSTLTAGFGGRDGGYLHFGGGAGGLRVRGSDGVSRAAFGVGNNPGTGTGAGITNRVDFSGHTVDLLLSALVIGNYNNAGAYENTFTFDTGTLDALSTSLSVTRNNNANAPFSFSTLNISGGTASLGPVNLTASVAAGNLNIANASVTVSNITSPGAGLATLDINNATLNVALGAAGNPVTAPVAVDNFNANGTVNLGFSGSGFAVGQFPFISYAGAIGGSGFSALNLASLPAGVGAYLSNNVANLSVDLVITNAPVLVNTNPTNLVAVVNGGSLELSWPADHTGWHLQAQTNALSSGLGTNWVTIPNTQLGNKYTNTIDSAKGSVFYRMVYP